MELALNASILKALGYGLSGFAFLLVFMSYRLLSQEQQQKEPRKLIIQTIWGFMVMTLLLTIIVGFISVPIYNKNDYLIQENDEAKSKIDTLAKETSTLVQVVKVSDLTKQVFEETNQVDSLEFERMKSYYIEEIEDLEKKVGQWDKTQSKEIGDVRERINNNLNEIQQHRTNADSIKILKKELSSLGNELRKKSVPVSFLKPKTQ